jgi:hypothetical protein
MILLELAKCIFGIMAQQGVRTYLNLPLSQGFPTNN